MAQINSNCKSLWIIVKVWRGIPAGIEVLKTHSEAIKREAFLRQSIAPEDEIALFESNTPCD